MKYIKTYEQFINESNSFEQVNEVTEDRFEPVTINRSNEVNKTFFKKLMPKSAKTSDSATSHIFTYQGNTMFVHYQYHIVKPLGNKPDRPTYRIHQSQYWLNDTQLKWQGRPGEKVNVTLLTIYVLNDGARPMTSQGDDYTRLGSVYVDTDVFLDEMKRVFEVIDRQS
jgi:hypothetical protein